MLNRTKVNLFLVRKLNLAQLESRRAQQKQNLVDRVQLVPFHLLKCQSKKAVLLDRLKSNNEIESLKQRQGKERFDFEDEQLKYKLFQREKTETKTNLRRLKQKRFQEEGLCLSRLRDEQERKHQQQLEETRLRAELYEAQAMMDVHETNKETNLSIDVPLFHDHKLIVSNLFSNKYASNGIKNDGLSELTAHSTFDKCNPSSDHLTKSMFIADTKIASSASQNHNLGQNINPEPIVTKEPTKTKQ